MQPNHSLRQSPAMTTVLMPVEHPVSPSFSMAGFLDVDGAGDKSAYFAFLDSVAAAFREVTEYGVDLLRLGAGDSVLDVGCGHGSCAPLLARRVGPSGRVVALDSSRAMVAEARRRFARSGLSVEFHVGNALSLPFADASFDAARADRVFMFLDDSERALSELVRVTMPGGRIVVTEGDLGSHSIDASDVATTRALLAALCDRSPNGWIGRRLRALVAHAGLGDIELKLVPLLTTSFTEWSQRLGIERLVSNAIADGSVDSRRAMAWIDELRARDADGLFSGTAMLYMVAGTRPGERAAKRAPKTLHCDKPTPDSRISAGSRCEPVTPEDDRRQGDAPCR